MNNIVRIEAPDGRVMTIEWTHSDVVVKMMWNPFVVREGETESLMCRIEEALEYNETRIIQGIHHSEESGEWSIIIDTAECTRWDSWEVSEIIRTAFTGGDA